MRLGENTEARERFEQRLAELGVSNERTGDRSRLMQEDAAFQVIYDDGTRRLLDWHLKGSNTRDPRYCLRVYYFFDEAKYLPVVGWLPSHLRTRVT